KRKSALKDVSTRKENLNPRSAKELVHSSPNKPVRRSATDSIERSSSNLNQKCYASHTSQLLKHSPVVTLSYISIHGGDDQNLELNTIASDDPITKSLIQSSRMHNNVNNHSLKVERSRTTFVPSKSKLVRNDKLERLDLYETVQKDAFHSNLDNRPQTIPDLRLQHSPGDKSVRLPKPKAPDPSYLESSRVSSIPSKLPLTHSLPNTKISMDKGIWSTGERKTEPLSFYYHPEKR
ncbi:unnamed protein product, partial [Candidula unifasciata]